MNFENMLEVATASGYFIVIGVVLLTAAIQLADFRRKDGI
jgi:Mg2+ and Co2+ transporter CorA